MSLQNPLGHFINGEFLWILAVALSGISSIMGAVNFVTTIIRMRAPGMSFFKMPIFVWTAWAAQTIQLVGLPALTGGAVMLLFDLSFGTTFFRPEGGGDPGVVPALLLVLLAPSRVRAGAAGVRHLF